MLDLVGVELIFFTVSDMGLSVLETLLTIQGCVLLLLSIADTEQRAFLLLTPLTSKQAGAAQGAGGKQLGLMIQLTKGIMTTDHVATCSACKAGKRRGKGGLSGVMVFIFPSNHCT